MFVMDLTVLCLPIFPHYISVESHHFHYSKTSWDKHSLEPGHYISLIPSMSEDGIILNVTEFTGFFLPDHLGGPAVLCLVYHDQ